MLHTHQTRTTRQWMQCEHYEHNCAPPTEGERPHVDGWTMVFDSRAHYLLRLFSMQLPHSTVMVLFHFVPHVVIVAYFKLSQLAHRTASTCLSTLFAGVDGTAAGSGYKWIERKNGKQFYYTQC